MKTLIVVLLSCLVSSMAYSAGFDCAKAATSSEKMICADKELSALDSQLSKAYKHTLNDSPAPNAVKAEQKQWLTEVRDVCLDETCLKQAYQARLQQLSLVKLLNDVAGDYERSDNNASITVEGADNDQFHVTGNAVWIGNAETGNVNTGELDGFFHLKGKQIDYRSGDDEYACKLTIIVNEERLTVTDDNGYCGGHNVSFNGEYQKKSSR